MHPPPPGRPSGVIRHLRYYALFSEDHFYVSNGPYYRALHENQGKRLAVKSAGNCSQPNPSTYKRKRYKYHLNNVCLRLFGKDFEL